VGFREHAAGNERRVADGTQYADVARAVAMSLFVAYIVLVIKGDLVARTGQKSAKTRC
jgi:hypothetical protein